MHTVFEVVFDGIGAQTALAGGGRYEITFPGQKRPVLGVGFAAGMERLLLAREACKVPAASVDQPDVFLVSLGDDAFDANFALAQQLRRNGLAVGMDLERRGMKPQMRAAGKSGAPYTVIRGEQELTDGVAVVKNMETGDQQPVPVTDLAAVLSTN